MDMKIKGVSMEDKKNKKMKIEEREENMLCRSHIVG
jgi:hypothetical protein